MNYHIIYNFNDNIQTIRPLMYRVVKILEKLIKTLIKKLSNTR